MNIGKATGIFKRINDNDIPYSDKIIAIGKVLNMPTHNGITKEQILQALRWLWSTTYKDVRECITGITLLSKAEYEVFYYNIKPIRDWWWLRSPGCISTNAAFVKYGGDISESGLDVSNSANAVRPALILKGSPEIGQSFTYGGKTWTVISDTLALADEPFCNMEFRKDWRADDANVYEASDIKAYLDSWLAAQETL